MKKIINGKLYNTETARHIYGWTNGVSTNDFCYICENLFQKKDGEFFIMGEGGAMTEYSKCSGGWSGYGYCLKPLSDIQAKAWLEKKGTTEIYIDIFGDCPESVPSIYSKTFQELESFGVKGIVLTDHLTNEPIDRIDLCERGIGEKLNHYFNEFKTLSDFCKDNNNCGIYLY